MAKKFTTQEWIKKVSIIHKNKYLYSKVNYIGAQQKVIITCPFHGDFEQKANHHMSGHGCKKCADIKVGNSLKKDLKDFIKQAKIIHNNWYDYSKSIYKSSKDKLIIICPLHGEFAQIPDSHINQKSGCPICSFSKGELLIYNWLKENNIPFKTQFELITPEIARNSNLIVIDFFIKYNEKQYFIEYDGEQHFKYISHFHEGGILDFKKQQRRDKVLNDFCELHKDKVTLIRFNYLEREEQILNQLNMMFK